MKRKRQIRQTNSKVYKMHRLKSYHVNLAYKFYTKYCTFVILKQKVKNLIEFAISLSQSNNF